MKVASDVPSLLGVAAEDVAAPLRGVIAVGGVAVGGVARSSSAAPGSQAFDNPIAVASLLDAPYKT